MSLSILLSILAFLCYSAAFVTLYRRVLAMNPLPQAWLPRFTWFGVGGLLLHALILSNELFATQGVNLGFYHALSLWGWFIGVLLLLMLLIGAIENLGVMIFPLLSIAVVLDAVFPSQSMVLIGPNGRIAVHIIISILAYSCLAMAAAQGAALGLQDRYLHRKKINAFTRAFPPLQVMEKVLFQLIAVGFVLQSFSLLSGIIFVENLFAQHLVHKTVLSIASWGIFGTLLWGRWRHGWRGKLVVRWLMVGFIILLLGYLGSKWVLEIILS